MLITVETQQGTRFDDTEFCGHFVGLSAAVGASEALAIDSHEYSTFLFLTVVGVGAVLTEVVLIL